MYNLAWDEVRQQLSTYVGLTSLEGATSVRISRGIDNLEGRIGDEHSKYCRKESLHTGLDHTPYLRGEVVVLVVNMSTSLPLKSHSVVLSCCSD